MSNIEILKVYVDILEKEGKEPTELELQVVEYLKKHRELYGLLRDIHNAKSKESRLNIIQNYEYHIYKDNFEEEKEIEFPEDALTYSNDFKDILKNKMDEYNIKDSIDLVYSNIKRYSTDMSLLNDELELELINRDSYIFYKELCEEYISTRNIEKVQARRLTLKESGYIIAIIASIISIIISIITFILIIK